MSRRAALYCRVLKRFLGRKAREIGSRGHSRVGFSCTGSTQFYTSLYAATLLKRAPREPLVVFGGGMFDHGNVGEFASAFGTVDVFVAGDGQDILVDAAHRVRRRRAMPRVAREGRPLPWADWRSAMRLAPGLRRVLRRQHGMFEPVVGGSNGCSWGGCRFCSLANQKPSVFRRPKEISEELAWLIKRYHIRGATFADLEINGSGERARELAEALRRIPVRDNHAAL